MINFSAMWWQEQDTFLTRWRCLLCTEFIHTFGQFKLLILFLGLIIVNHPLTNKKFWCLYLLIYPYIKTNIKIICHWKNQLSNLAIKSYSNFRRKTYLHLLLKKIFFGEIYDQQIYVDLPRGNKFLINNQRICLFIWLFTGKKKIVSSNSGHFILLLIKFY